MEYKQIMVNIFNRPNGTIRYGFSSIYPATMTDSEIVVKTRAYCADPKTWMANKDIYLSCLASGNFKIQSITL